MKLGVFTVLFGTKPFEAMLDFSGPTQEPEDPAPEVPEVPGASS